MREAIAPSAAAITDTLRAAAITMEVAMEGFYSLLRLEVLEVILWVFSQTNLYFIYLYYLLGA